jgi:hypothetical protein
MRYISLILLVFIHVTGFIRAQDTINNQKSVLNQPGNVLPLSRPKNLDHSMDFQFAIVADRAGGHRPGVFENAIEKLNLLQPEFVMSVGDLIEGYTTDKDEIYRQWTEFNGFIDKLYAPFFYVPGSHDYNNDVMAQIWEELYGSSYYYFMYKDVLFLILNSEESLKEDNSGEIDKTQYEYVKKILEKHADARWTFVFMHQPLWLNENTGYWNEIEDLLRTRKHTVFTSHDHRYMKYERNNGKYFTLASTGGISQLRGLNFGEFDHIVWITMTEEGPIIANLLLTGIWHEDIVTEDLINMINDEKIMINPVFIEDFDFDEAKFKIQIKNDHDYPMLSYLAFNKNQYLIPGKPTYQKEVEPNSNEILTISVNSSQPIDVNMIEPLNMNALFIYKYKDNREIPTSKKYLLIPVKKEYADFTRGKIWIDGNLDEWEGLPFRVNAKSYKTGDLSSYSGDYDGSFEFDIRYDYENLYIAISVWDDELILDKKKSLWSQDALHVYVDARPLLTSSNERGQQIEDFLHILFAPSPGKKNDIRIYQQDQLPADISIAADKTVAGFDAELSIPLKYLEEKNGDEWQNLRFNAAFIDCDQNDSRTSIWYVPEWSSEKNYIGSGMFFRQKD